MLWSTVFIFCIEVAYDQWMTPIDFEVKVRKALTEKSLSAQ
jgi:hypothetical protein